MNLSVQDLEAAINFWRERQPARGNEHALSPQVSRLATLYALMIFRGLKTVPMAGLDPGLLQLLQAWRHSLPQSTKQVTR